MSRVHGDASFVTSVEHPVTFDAGRARRGDRARGSRAGGLDVNRRGEDRSKSRDPATRVSQGRTADRCSSSAAARSGTSWVGRLLGRTAGAAYVHEPDSPWEPFAARARAGLGSLPAVDAGDSGPPLYAHLWDVAFTGRRRYPTNRLAYQAYARIPKSEKLAALDQDATSHPFRLRIATRLAQPASPLRGARPAMS